MRTRLLGLFAIVSCSVLLAGCDLNPFRKKSGIQITSNRQVEVVMNGEPIGKTPIYEDNQKPGVYTIQLTAKDSDTQPWEGKVNLNPGTVTYIDRQFETSPACSHGHSFVYEKLSNSKNIETNIVSIPTASVSIDGRPAGFTPLSVNDLTDGPHTITLTAPGYQDKIVKGAVRLGYRLMVSVEMATQTVIIPVPTPEATPSGTIALPTPSPAKTAITPLPKQSSPSATPAKPYVQILDTPTGWLKVREQPNLSGAEIAKVNPGDTFSYREASASGWFNIEYLKGSWGFVSSQYAKLVK